MSIPVTVPGVANGSHVYSTITLQYQTQQNANIAVSLLSQIYAAAGAPFASTTGGILGVQNDSEGVTTGSGTPSVFEFTIGDSGGVQNTGTTEGTVPAGGYNTIIDAFTGTTTPSEIVNATGQTNDLVLSSGYLHFYTEGGSGTVIAGAGGNFIQTATSGEGDWVVFFDGGDNTVNANSGNFFIEDGNASTTGANLIFLGTGNSTVFSYGTDTIIGGANGGNNVVASFTSGTQYWASSGNNAFVNLGGADTFVGGSGNDTIYALTNDASQGGGLYFGTTGSTLMVQGPTDSSTVVSGAGNATIFADPGSSGVYFVGGSGTLALAGGGSETVGGAAGSGPAVIFGINGQNLTLFGSNTDVFVSTGGSETVNAALTSGSAGFWTGGGSDSITAGSGNDTLVMGSGSNTLTGGAGPDVFAAIQGQAGGNELINGWNSSDTLALIGYGALGSNGLPSGASASGNVLLLSDGTKITFAGLANTSSVHITTF